MILLLVAAACCLAPPRRRLLGAAAAFVPRRPTSVGGRAAVAFGGGASRSSAGAAIGDDAAAAAAVVRSNEGTALASLDSLTGAMAERATGLLSRLGGENNADNAVVRTDKDAFLASLDTLDSLNDATKERTGLLNSLIENKNEVRDLARPSTSSLSSSSSSSPSLERPGSVEAFMDVAPGTWSVVYAPHMTTMAGLVGGSLGVEYDLRDDGTVISHARYDVPLFGQRGYLSVSGTYGSEDGADVCRVDFDEAWVRPVSSSLDGNDGEDEPYPTVGDVPDSFVKGVIRTLGRAAFIKEVSVFPVSFLDDDLIVFDFELLGTRICARKML